MSEAPAVPAINEAGLKNFGQRLLDLFVVHRSNRKAAEDKWLRNLRAYKGIYDPEILALIGKDQSKAYPKMLRWKVIGTVARLLQMLFPQTEKNYGVRASPLPDLTTEQLQHVLDTLVSLTAERDNILPAYVMLDDKVIEKAIYEFAAEKAEQMEKKIDDDLQEMDFITLARKVVFSGCLYSVGILKGPFHKKVKARKWERNPNNGAYRAIEVDKFKPLFEYLRIWDWYPDMTANSIAEQDGEFERHCMTRQMVEELMDRPDFLADRIEMWLKNNVGGNYVPEWWESVMKGEVKSDKQYVANKEGSKYEVLAYIGNVSGHELKAAGVEISDAQLARSFHADVWIIGNTVIKAKLSPLQDHRRHHTFVFEEDDLSLLGNSQADTLRDSQLSICEASRAALDNMSVIGPMAVVNDDVLTPGQNTDIRKHKTWHVEGLSSNQALNAAVANVEINSHLQELQALLGMFMDFANQESGLPPPSMGDVSGGGSEALRTTQNASMFLGASSLPLRDTVRNYDTFTISFTRALVAWNQKYDPNPNRDGDVDIIARGSTSLVAKEVLAGNLAEFRASVTEDELPYIKSRGMLIQRAKANDIPIDEVLEDEDVAQQKIDAQQAAAQKQADLQEGIAKAEIQETMSLVIKHIADARKSDASIATEEERVAQAAGELLLKALTAGHETRIKEKVANKPAATGAK